MILRFLLEIRKSVEDETPKSLWPDIKFHVGDIFLPRTVSRRLTSYRSTKFCGGGGFGISKISSNSISKLSMSQETLWTIRCLCGTRVIMCSVRMHFKFCWWMYEYFSCTFPYFCRMNCGQASRLAVECDDRLICKPRRGMQNRQQVQRVHTKSLTLCQLFSALARSVYKFYMTVISDAVRNLTTLVALYHTTQSGKGGVFI